MQYYKNCQTEWYQTMNNEDVFKILDKDCTQLLDDKHEYAYLRKKAKKTTSSYYEGEMVGLNEQSPDEVPIVSFSMG